MSKNKSSVTNTVKTLREQNKISQTDMAKLVGVSRQTIVSIEKGAYSPSLELAFKIAYVLNKKIEEIFEFDVTLMKGIKL